MRLEFFYILIFKQLISHKSPIQAKDHDETQLIIDVSINKIKKNNFQLEHKLTTNSHFIREIHKPSSKESKLVPIDEKRITSVAQRKLTLKESPVRARDPDELSLNT